MSRDEAYLRHVLDAIEIVQHYAGTGEDDFMQDGMRQDATVRQLAVIREAVKRLSGGNGSSRLLENDLQRNRVPPILAFQFP